MSRQIALFLSLFLILTAPVLAQQTTTYDSPDGGFSALIPAGWTDESTTDYGLFTGPNDVQVYLLAVKPDPDEDAIVLIRERIGLGGQCPYSRCRFPDLAASSIRMYTSSCQLALA